MSRIEWMAVGWGALVAGVGLVVVAEDPGPVKLAVGVALFGLAGFLAAVRAEERRVLHSGLGACAGAGFYLIYVVLSWLVSQFTGPDHPEWLPGGDRWQLWLPALLFAALIGGLLAAYRLRPHGDARPRRRANN